MTPFFSLILPVYNVEAYLERCIHSILVQSFSDYEVILVDDGSTDRSAEICDQYAAEYPCVNVIHKKNGGLSSARNAGMDAAAGKYVWFVDSDDWIESGALETLYYSCHDDEADMIKFGYYRVEDGKKEGFEPIIFGKYESGEELDLFRRRAFCEPGRLGLSVWAHIYKRSFLSENTMKFVSERIVGSEDYLFNLIALMHVSSIKVIDRVLYNYELRSGSLTQQYKPDLSQRYAQLHRMLKEYEVKSENMARHDTLIDRFYVWHLMYGIYFGYEYGVITDKHALKDGRKNVKRALKDADFQDAIRSSDRTGLTWKRWILLLAMRMRMEAFIFLIRV